MNQEQTIETQNNLNNVAQTLANSGETLSNTPVPPVTEQQSLIDILFGHGDWVLQATFSAMVIMSVLSWTIILYRSIYGINVRLKMKKHLAILMSNTYQNYTDMLKAMEGKSPIKSLLNTALTAEQEFSKADGILSRSLNYSDYLMSAIKHTLDAKTSAQDGGLTFLASVGATAPFVGLFGTVWGIYHALLNISQMGSVNIATISGPIGEALIATAFGLFVAIPAVLAYNALNRTNKLLSRKLDTVAHNLYRLFLHKKA